MTTPLTRFPKNDIMSLTVQTPRYDLAESVGPDLHLGDLAADAPDDLAGLALDYGPTAGHPDLREMLAQLYGVEADDVVTTIGGMHALFLIAFILCDPGDEAVTTAPLFPNATNTLKAVGADIKTLTVTFEQQYRIDLDALRQLLSPRTKLVSLASPQNPSGVALDRETVRAVIEMMAAICPDAYLLMDETYRDAVYGDDEPAENTVTLSSKVISCASLSKCHGAPGLRLGWAITRDPAMREQLIVGKFNTVVCCSRVDEALAMQVLKQRGTIIDARRTQLASGLQRTEDWVGANGAFVEWVRPSAGALCCVRLKPGAFDDAAVDRFYSAMHGHAVRVANGSWFGDEKRVFRLGFGLLSMPDLDAGLAALSAALVQASREAA